MNVGHASVERAKTVQRAGIPELVQSVEQGAVSVSAAAQVATQPIEEQREIVARGDREILQAAQAIRARKAEVRHAERIERLVHISGQNRLLPQDCKYPVVYADPPWHFDVYNEMSGVERAAENHYPTLALDDICALPVADLATDDAVLFLWTTASHLQEFVERHSGLGLSIRQQHRLAEGQARPWLLGSQPARSFADLPSRRHAHTLTH